MALLRGIFFSGLLALHAAGGSLQAQSLAPRAVVPAGGTGAGAALNWTLGQPASATYTGYDALLTAGVQQPEAVLLSLNIAALLDGPYDAITHLMYDSLRTRGFIPLTEPFTALGYPPVGLQGGSQLAPTALLNAGPNALVDWVFIELRDASDPSTVHAARAAVLQRDGDVVDVDGISPVRIAAVPGPYRIALLHRNHLPVMSAAPVSLGAGPNVINFTNGSTALHVSNAEVLRDGRFLLWQGDVTGNGAVQYTGSGNDRDPVLVAVGGAQPNNTISGYLPSDVNLDGTVKYTGSRNDRDPILVTIGGTVPTAVRAQPLP